MIPTNIKLNEYYFRALLATAIRKDIHDDRVDQLQEAAGILSALSAKALRRIEAMLVATADLDDSDASMHIRRAIREDLHMDDLTASDIAHLVVHVLKRSV